jgi:hypothetical protein
MSCGHTGHDRRCPPRIPLVIEAAEPASVEMAPAAPDGAALVPVLVLPGVRVYVDVSRTETEAARWWHQLGVAALLAAASYDEHGSVSAR